MERSKMFYIILFLVSIKNGVTFEVTPDCVGANNITGVCRRIEDCSSVVENEDFVSQCGLDNGTLVCCLTNRSEENKILASASVLKCKQYSEEVSLLPKAPIPEDAIIDGRIAGDGDFPHMGALGFLDNNDIKWLCGGSLISPRFVLTAAHCLQHRSYGNVSIVRLGDIFLDGSSNTHQDYQVITSTAHPDFKPPIIYHDIALLELNQSVVFTTYIQPACLNIQPNIHFSWNPQILGWGLTEFGGSTSISLQFTEIQVFTNEECHDQYKKNARKYPQGILEDVQICAGGRESQKDACQGDSGGPLQFYNYSYNMYNLFGVISFGRACGIQGVPGIYTKISYYVPWIESIVWS